MAMETSRRGFMALLGFAAASTMLPKETLARVNDVALELPPLEELKAVKISNSVKFVLPTMELDLGELDTITRPPPPPSFDVVKSDFSFSGRSYRNKVWNSYPPKIELLVVSDPEKMRALHKYVNETMCNPALFSTNEAFGDLIINSKINDEQRIKGHARLLYLTDMETVFELESKSEIIKQKLIFQYQTIGRDGNERFDITIT